MNDAKTLEILDRINETYKSGGIVAETLAPIFLELRERALALQNPLMAKLTRMTAEHLQENGDFLIQYVEADEVGGLNNFEYFLQLMREPENKYNKEELQEYRDLLKMWPETV